jgi:hypothetical protein
MLVGLRGVMWIAWTSIWISGLVRQWCCLASIGMWCIVTFMHLQSGLDYSWLEQSVRVWLTLSSSSSAW